MTAVLDPEFTPLRDGYTLNPSYPVVDAKFAGLTKKRQDNLRLHAPHIATVNWVMNSPQQYTRFMGFFRTALQEGTLAFLMDLVSDIKTPTTHRCRSRGRLPKLTQIRGNSFYVSCDLEIDVNPTVTGIIEYHTDNFIVFIRTFPFTTSFFNPGDNVRILEASGIHPDGDTALNLDGVYTIESTSGLSTILLENPELVNSDWTTLSGLSPDEFGGVETGNIRSTITKVPV